MYITVIVDSNYEQEQMIAALAGMLQSAMYCTPLAKKIRWIVVLISLVS